MKQHVPLALLTVMTVMIVTALVANADQDGPDLEKLTTPQTWVGKNGNSIRGVFILREGDFVRITNRQGKA